ncbi:MAG TPA: pilus assembly protein TadG-related protein [Candidatus Tumulicola sp.]|nr:pilus assembly protein TadG-related protein [Candidatus Tumulicola sp.]
MCSKENQRGQVVPLVALCLAALMGFGAFAVDMGYLRYQQRLQQYAVDAAALQAAWQLQTVGAVAPATCGDPSQHGSPSAVCKAGQSASGTNGFSSPSTCGAATKTCVSVNYPPSSGAYSGDTSAVEALVSVQQPGFFSRIFGFNTNRVTTRAVALVRGNGGGPCIYTLSGSLVVNAGAQVNAPCGLLVGKNLQAASADAIHVPSIGTIGNIQCSTACDPTKTVEAQNILPFADPCPTIPGCVTITSTFPDGQTPGAGPLGSCSSISGSPTTLTSGCYSNSKVTFNDVDLGPGLYVFQGDVTANNVTCSTCVTSGTSQNGVTLVIGGKVNLNGATTSLQAPPGGQGVGPAPTTAKGTPGVIVYQTGAGNCTSPQNSFAGTLKGMIYAPTCQFNVNAGSTMTLDFLVVAQMEANGIVLTVPNDNHPGIPQNPSLAE